MSAGKQKFREDDLASLFGGATRILVGKGKKFLEFDPRKDEAADIAAVALGRSGTLRAPSIRVGKTWVVGFNDDMYAAIL